MTEKNMEIANTIIAQMGGAGRLSAMIGANTFVAIENGLQFRFKASKTFNTCIVRLNGKDLYEMEIGQIRKKKGVPTYVQRYEVSDIYFDQLKPLFEQATGLYLSL